MTSARIIDTHRLSIVANACEREMVRFQDDLVALAAKNGHGDAVGQRIRQEMERVGFEEIQVTPTGNISGRIGSGKWVIRMDSHIQAPGGGMACLVYAGKLIHELGMYGDFTLWVTGTERQGKSDLPEIHADCAVVVEPTGLCIHRGHRGRVPIGESHPLVRSAIATYEALFELPPVVHAGATILATAPAVGFGPGDGNDAHVPAQQLIKAAQFYAAFPATYVDTVTRR